MESVTDSMVNLNMAVDENDRVDNDILRSCLDPLLEALQAS